METTRMGYIGFRVWGLKLLGFGFRAYGSGFRVSGFFGGGVGPVGSRGRSLN